MNPWDKWAKRPTPELVSRLIDLTSLVMEVVEDAEAGHPLEVNPYDHPAYVDADGNVRNTTHDGVPIDGNYPNVNTVVEGYTSEAHWIAEEIEHRIRKTEYAGLLDIEIANCHSGEHQFKPNAIYCNCGKRSREY